MLVLGAVAIRLLRVSLVVVILLKPLLVGWQVLGDGRVVVDQLCVRGAMRFVEDECRLLLAAFCSRLVGGLRLLGQGLDQLGLLEELDDLRLEHAAKLIR